MFYLLHLLHPLNHEINSFARTVISNLMTLLIRGLGDDAELSVDDVVECVCLIGREGVVRSGAGKGLLAEDRGVATDERKLVVTDRHFVLIYFGETDVEDLTVVLLIGVEAVDAALAREGGGQGRLQDELVVGGEVVSTELGQGHGGEGHQQQGRESRHYAGGGCC